MKRRVWRILQTVLILIIVGMSVQAQPVVIKDIPDGSTNFVAIGGFTYFTAGDALWRTDGTSGGTIMLKSGLPTAPFGFRQFKDDYAIFLTGKNESSSSPYSSTQLWRTDGTPGGTIQLLSKDLIGLLDGTANHFFFFGEDAASGRELYRTDGTVAGTLMLKDINPGSASSLRGPSGRAVSNELIFAADNGTNGLEPWKSDGTSQGTVMIEDIYPGAQFGVYLGTNSFVYNNLYYFMGSTDEHGVEPWVSDGTPDGTRLLKDITPGAAPTRNVQFAIGHNGYLYFFLLDDYDAGPAALWRTAGTETSTSFLKTIGEGAASNIIHFFLVYQNKVYFWNRMDQYREDLWVTDGTGGGTYSFFSFTPIDGAFTYFDAVGDYMLFTGTFQERPLPLYRSDGTTEGTQEVTRFKSAGFYDGDAGRNITYVDVTTVGDYAFYADHDGTSDGGVPHNGEDYFHLFQTDGVTAQSMRTLYGVSTVGTKEIVNYNGKVIFTTRNDQDGSTDTQTRLWIYDPSNSQAYAGHFTLVNADTDQDIQTINQDDVITVPENVNINIRFNPVGNPGSVKIAISGDPTSRFENEAPFSLAGDINGDYNAWAGGGSGGYPLYAIPYSEDGGKGEQGTMAEVDFTLVRTSSGDNCTASGTILREQWNNVSGNNVSAIPVNSQPGSRTSLNIFEGPANSQTNFGARLRGYICPPATGNYTFWIASNDHSELWLSTDDDPSNKVKIAYVTGATTPRQWTKFPTQKSAAVNLTAGKRYYIEALHKQGVGTQNIAVGWQLPDGSLERPIPGNRLSPPEGAGNSNPQVYIVDPGNTYNYSSPADVAMTASATDPDGSIALVEFFIGSDKIGEDRDAREEQYFDYRWMDVGPGTYTLTAKATDNEGATSVSEPVTFQVTYYPCNTSGTITRDYWPNVSGDRVSDVPEGSFVPYTNELTIFEGPSNIGDNYATRIRGYICVPETGGYKFWIASNDHSELRLSTDDDPANKVRIAWVTGATNPRQWDKYSSQVSNTIMLQQGQLYYIEAVHKEAVGTDHIAVGWQLPDGTMERPIPGSRLLYDFRNQRSAQAETSDAGKTTQYSQINIYPNPMQSGDPELTISGYEAVEPVETDIQIMNMTGEVVFAERIQCGGNCSTYLMNVNKQLVPGVYLVNMKTNGIRNSRRLLVK